jgi:hypothetical protein
MATKTTGRQQAKQTKTAQARTPDLSKFYRYRQPAIIPGDFTFMLELVRPKLPVLPLDRMVTLLTWDDESSGMTGSLTVQRPIAGDATSLPITRGMLIRCRVKWAGGIYHLWTMRAGAPQAEVDAGAVTIPLTDDMALVDGGTRDWWFRKTKRRPFGYRCDEIAGAVAATLGLRLRSAARGTTRFELKMRGRSGLAVLRQAYQNERNKSGRAFIIRVRDGELEIVPVARNTIIYQLGAQIQTALITQKGGQKIPTTVLTGRGRVGTGKHTKTLSYVAHDAAVVRLLGYVPDTKDFGKVDSFADLRDQTKRELAKRLRLTDTVSITHQGIPFIVRGDGIELELRGDGYKGADSFLWCIRAVHTVQAGVYQTQWDFNATDPYLGLVSAAKSQNPKTKAKTTAAKRAAKRAVRARPKLKK